MNKAELEAVEDELPDEQIDTQAAERMLLGMDPELSPEQLSEIESILKTVEPRVEEPPYIVKDHFKKGMQINDPHNGVVLHVRSAGAKAMNVAVIGKKAKWVVGYTVSMDDQMFIVKSTKKNTAVMEHMGPTPQPPKE